MRLCVKGAALTGEGRQVRGCDRGGCSSRLAPPPGPSSGASRHRSMVEISPPRLFSRSERARGYPEVAPSAITLRDLSVVGVVRAGAQQWPMERPSHPPRASSIDVSHRAPLLSQPRACRSSTNGWVQVPAGHPHRRARDARSWSRCATARPRDSHPPLTSTCPIWAHHTRPSRCCRSGCRSRTAVFTATNSASTEQSIRPHRRRSLSRARTSKTFPRKSSPRVGFAVISHVCV